MAMEMSFSDDFWTRYAGAETTTGAAEQEADQAVRRESRELQLEAQRRAARDTDFAESVYSIARAELKSADPGSTPTGVAMNYTADVARMKSYAEAGDLPKAFGVHQQLRANAAANRDIYIDRMHAQPRTPDEQQINQLYMSYVSNAFDGVKLQLKDGWTGTVGELFGDTEEYKKHDIDTLARAGFSAGQMQKLTTRRRTPTPTSTVCSTIRSPTTWLRITTSFGTSLEPTRSGSCTRTPSTPRS